MIDETQVQDVTAVLVEQLGLEASEQVKAKVRTLIQELRPVPAVPFVPVPVVKNNAALAIERAQTKLAAKQATAGVAVAEPPTNAQRAAYICHQGGVRYFAQFFTELLDRIQALEKRISDSSPKQF